MQSQLISPLTFVFTFRDEAPFSDGGSMSCLDDDVYYNEIPPVPLPLETTSQAKQQATAQWTSASQWPGCTLPPHHQSQPDDVAAPGKSRRVSILSTVDPKSVMYIEASVPKDTWGTFSDSCFDSASYQWCGLDDFYSSADTGEPVARSSDRCRSSVNIFQLSDLENTHTQLACEPSTSEWLNAFNSLADSMSTTALCNQFAALGHEPSPAKDNWTLPPPSRSPLGMLSISRMHVDRVPKDGPQPCEPVCASTMDVAMSDSTSSATSSRSSSTVVTPIGRRPSKLATWNPKQKRKRADEDGKDSICRPVRPKKKITKRVCEDSEYDPDSDYEQPLRGKKTTRCKGSDEDDTEKKKKKRYPCTIGDCKAVFTRSNDVTRHETTVHGPKLFCDRCYANMSRQDSLDRHKELNACHKREPPSGWRIQPDGRGGRKKPLSMSSPST